MTILAKNMISAQEARDAGPIADYIAVSRELQAQIWHGIYRRKNHTLMSLEQLARRVNVVSIENADWYCLLVVELEALGYTVTGGLVEW